MFGTMENMHMSVQMVLQHTLLFRRRLEVLVIGKQDHQGRILRRCSALVRGVGLHGIGSSTIDGLDDILFYSRDSLFLRAAFQAAAVHISL